jgi:hypothetical protein
LGPFGLIIIGIFGQNWPLLAFFASKFLQKSLYYILSKNLNNKGGISKMLNFDKYIIPEDSKQPYVADFEKLTGLTLYLSTAGYFYILDGHKVKISAFELKNFTKYQTIEDLRKMAPDKKQSIADRQILKKWAAIFKQNKNKKMWHQICQIIRIWDTLDNQKKTQIFEKLNRNFPDFANQLSENSLN